jgi:SAM-dependent methyltransferase
MRKPPSEDGQLSPAFTRVARGRFAATHTPVMSDYDPVAFDAFEAAGWSTKEAAGYDALAGRVTSRLADPLLDAVGAGPGKRVLDIATGPGYVAARAAERGADSVGLDFSETMLAFARSRSPNVEFVRGDATELPFLDGSFDAATCAFLLLHLGRPEAAVVEAARVLAPGGSAAFSVWDEPSRGRWLGVVFDAFTVAGALPPPDVPHGPPFFRLADDGEFTRLLTDAGLADVTIETVEFPLRLTSGDELWNGLIDGSVRVRPMILGQSSVMQRAIRMHFDELVEGYRSEDGYALPVSVKLASARKP